MENKQEWQKFRQTLRKIQ